MMTPDTSPERPLVTFALFAYNQENYIRAAVEGAFAQTYQPLEIILSDDCSKDRTFEIMQEMAAVYKGPHRVILRQNAVNQGLASHVNVVFEESGGDIILLAAGDDISLPERTEISVDLLTQNPAASAVLLSANVMNADGNVIGRRSSGRQPNTQSLQTLHDLLNWRHRTFGATRAIRRRVAEIFGALNSDCPTEDTPLLLRSLICGDNILSPRIGVLYRVHSANLSGAASLKSMNFDAIYDQYSSDIDLALERQLLAPPSVAQLREWMLPDRTAREIRLKQANNEKPSVADLVFIVRHTSFGFKDKIKTLSKFALIVLGRPV